MHIHRQINNISTDRGKQSILYSHHYEISLWEVEFNVIIYYSNIVEYYTNTTMHCLQCQRITQ